MYEYRAIKRILSGHNVAGYIISNGERETSVNTEQFKDLVRRKMIINCSISGETVTGINGFQLKELESIQISTIKPTTEMEILRMVYIQHPEGGYFEVGAEIVSKSIKDRKEVISEPFCTGFKELKTYVKSGYIRDENIRHRIAYSDKIKKLTEKEISKCNNVIKLLSFGSLMEPKLEIADVNIPNGDSLNDLIRSITYDINNKHLLITKKLEFGNNGGVNIKDPRSLKRELVVSGIGIGYEIYNNSNNDIYLGIYKVAAHSRTIISRIDLKGLHTAGEFSKLLNGRYREDYDSLAISSKVPGEFETIQTGIIRPNSKEWELNKKYASLYSSLEKYVRDRKILYHTSLRTPEAEEYLKTYIVDYDEDDKEPKAPSTNNQTTKKVNIFNMFKRDKKVTTNKG